MRKTKTDITEVLSNHVSVNGITFDNKHGAISLCFVMHEVNMRDKWGLYKKPYISWLGRHSRAKVRTNAIKLQDRQNAAQQQQCEDYIDQFRTLLPNLQLDMALVLVLVQDLDEFDNIKITKSNFVKLKSLHMI